MEEKISRIIPLILFAFIFLGPILGGKGLAVLILVILAAFLANYIKQKGLIFNNNFNFHINKEHMPKTIDMDSIKNVHKMKKTIISIILLVFALWLFFASIVIVEAGETGVYSLFGKVKDDELSSGFHLVIPLAKVTPMSIRTEEYTMSIQKDEGKRTGADAITSLTKEGLNVDLDMTVLYHLEEDKASDVYREVGLDYDEKLIRPTIRTSIRDAIAQYEAKDIYSEKREEAASKITDGLRNSLKGRGIVIEQVLLRNVALPANLANAIQDKLQAEQEAQKYDFILDKEKKEKERKVIEAEGQRDAQKIINESLSTNYLYYLYISGLKDREGTVYVPTSPGTGMPLFKDLGN